jgi:hypothetical protein
MQKRTLFARARRGLLALLGLCLGGFAAPTFAGVYQASTDVPLSILDFGNTSFSLPKYSGPGKITGITLTLSGSGQATKFFNFFHEVGITVAPSEETLDFLVAGPPFISGGEDLVLDVPTTVTYPGVSVPPCAECGPGPAEVDTPPISATFLGSVNLTDFSDFAGNGSNDFVFAISAGANETIDASGTVTETIFTSIPEPSTWAMMLLGFAGLGYAGYRASRRTAAAGLRA